MKTFYKNLSGFLKSVFIVLFRNIKVPGVFYGYQNLWFADLYRMKREFCWRKRWNQLGKRQFVLKLMPGKLLVCSRLEIEVYKKKGLITNKISTSAITRRSL